MRTRSIQVSMFVILAFLMTETAAAQYVYNVTVLGTANSGLSSAGKINRWGQIAGQGANGHAMLWTPTADYGTTGTLKDLQTAAGFPAGSASSWASALNDRGQVAGGAYTPGHGDGNQTQSWMWRPKALNSSTGVLHGDMGKAVTFPLVTIPGLGTSSEHPSGINNHGVIVGFGIYYHALLWTPSVNNGKNGTWTYEPTYCSQTSGINDAGQIIGGACEGQYNLPFLHTGPFPMQGSDLITSPLWLQPPSYDTIGYATGINRAGHLAITALDAAGTQIRAYLYKNGKAIDISGGQGYSNTSAINNHNQVIGQISSTTYLAVIYQGGKPTDLNTISAPLSQGSYLLTSAIDINDAGEIICSGNYDDGKGYYGSGKFLLTLAH
jgi:uncharacterized membrane protein